MMSANLAINSDRFAQETIDGETIIMDTVSGRLLLLRETAPLLLSILKAGLPLATVLEEIAGRYGAETATQARDFVATLTELGVLATQDSAAVSGAPSPAGAIDWPSNFAAPIIERYDDIADIITMDPIHDVDTESGWPRAAATPRE
jgi:hypothetical protein